MKRIILSLVLCCAFIGSGCSTKSAYQPVDGGTLEAQAQFAVGSVEDQSGFVPDEKEPIDLQWSMNDALNEALKNEGVLGQGGYLINTTILHYSPGNAFTRWIAPGAGATKLHINSTVLNSQGKTIATIPVERSIAAGGGYTIGAWKYVFKEVAQEIVAVLKKEINK